MSQQGLFLFAASVFAYSFLAVAFSSNKLKTSLLKRLMQSSSSKQPQLSQKPQYIQSEFKDVNAVITPSTFKNTINKIYLNNPKVVFQFQVRDNTHDSFHEDIKCVINEIVPGASQLTLEDLEINALSGGITNLLYIVHLIPLKVKVIIRLFGHGTSKFVDRNTENIVFSSLSQANISPIFYGLFTNGRVEGYLPYRALTPEETKHPQYIPLIAQGVSELHNQKLTNISTDLCGWGMLETFLYLAQETITNASTCNITVPTNEAHNSNNNSHGYNIAFLNQDSLLIHHTAISRMMKEYEWLKPKILSFIDMSLSYTAFNTVPTASLQQQQSSLSHTSSKSSVYSNTTATTSASAESTTNKNNHNVTTKSFFEWRGFSFGLEKVLAHNDLLSGNLLFNNEEDEEEEVRIDDGNSVDGENKARQFDIDKKERKLVLIDFEYAGYNLRAWDIANHFCESAGFDANFKKDFMTINQRMLFYSHYIQSHVKHMEAQMANHNDDNSHTETTHNSNNHNFDDDKDRTSIIHNTSTTTTTTTVSSHPVTVPIDLGYINNLLCREGIAEYLLLHQHHHDDWNETSPFNQQASTSSSSSSTTPIKSSSLPSSSSSLYFQSILSPTTSSTDIAGVTPSSSSVSHLHVNHSSSLLLSPNEEKDLFQFLTGFDDVVCKFTLISHLFWGSWAIMQAANSKIDFGFAGYSLKRYKGYFLHKQLFFPEEKLMVQNSSNSNSKKS